MSAPGSPGPAWLQGLTDVLRRVDSYGHLIKCSSSGVADADLWGKAMGDINDVHPYFGWTGVGNARDISSLIWQSTRNVARRPEPFLVAETGIAREVQTELGLAADLADRDRAGVHLHEALWGGLFSGACGSGMIWWWDEETDVHDWYWRFRGIARFASGIPWNKLRLRRRRSLLPATGSASASSSRPRAAWLGSRMSSSLGTTPPKGRRRRRSAMRH